MSDQRGGNLRGPEGRGTARDLGFELLLFFYGVSFEFILVVVAEEMFLTMVIQSFARLL